MVRSSEKYDVDKMLDMELDDIVFGSTKENKRQDQNRKEASSYTKFKKTRGKSGNDSNRVYVSNISWDVQWQDLKDHMRGEDGNLNVVRADMMEDNTGRSKGWGIVQYSNSRDAEKAILELNNSMLMGRQLNIREDREGAGFRSGAATSVPDKCYNCGRSGHIAKDCMEEPQSDKCYTCGKPGHLARECRESQGDICFKCGRPGHFARDCKFEGGGGTTGNRCYRCGRVGHIARDCESEEKCYKCGEMGHIAKDCSMEGDGDVCYNCGKSGHIARECESDPQGEKCYNCGRAGHFARDCKLEALNNNCFNCGMPGHLARDCRAVGEGQNRNRGRRGSSTSLYVGNLPWDISWQDLKDHMRGTKGNLDIIRADIQEDSRGQSKGFAIVEYATSRDARRAIQEFNETELMDRTIFVREDNEGGESTYRTPNSRERSRERSPRRERYSRPRRSQIYGRKVYIGNLSFDCSWQDLKDYMREAGDVAFATLFEDRSGKSRGCGVVEFKTSEDAGYAIDKLNDSEFMGRKIHVREYREDSQ